MHVASDLDHVMCDLASQARIVLASDLGIPVEDIIETFVYHDSFAHADPVLHEKVRIGHSFWERKDIMRDALPMPGAVEAAWRLFDAGMLVSYVTRRSSNASDVTITWLKENHFPDVPVHFVGHPDPLRSYADCKSAACIRSGATLLMDDSQNEIARVVDSGLSAILLDAPVGRVARRAFLDSRPDILCLPSVTEAVDHLLSQRKAA